jgi:hypothetical protein
MRAQPGATEEGPQIPRQGLTFARSAGRPGWRWSTDARPIARTDSCRAVHTGLVLSGRLHVVMDDDVEEESGPGDLYHLPAGHDAWAVGDEPYACVDVTDGFEWAKPR